MLLISEDLRRFFFSLLVACEHLIGLLFPLRAARISICAATYAIVLQVGLLLIEHPLMWLLVEHNLVLLLIELYCAAAYAIVSLPLICSPMCMQRVRRLCTCFPFPLQRCSRRWYRSPRDCFSPL
jgi:hypothetical protein